MPTAFVLSGGGARGDFQVGAVRFLYDQNIRPDIICGTSVGAINGAKLAEGEGAQDQGLQGLEAIWSELRTDTDMYLEEDWLNRIDPSIKSYLTGKGPSSISLPLDLPQWEDIGSVLSKLPNLIFELWDKVPKLLETLGELSSATSLYNLQPLQRRLQQQVDANKIQAWSQGGSRKLRLATVSLESGVVRYITETGNVLEQDGSSVLVQILAPQCKAIADRIKTLENERRDLQKALSHAPSTEKPALASQIKALNQRILAEKQALIVPLLSVVKE